MKYFQFFSQLEKLLETVKKETDEKQLKWILNSSTLLGKKLNNFDHPFKSDGYSNLILEKNLIKLVIFERKTCKIDWFRKIKAVKSNKSIKTQKIIITAFNY